MGLWDKINEKREHEGKKPYKWSSREELREKRFKMAQKGLKFKSPDAKQYLAIKKQSRINKAINNPK